MRLWPYRGLVDDVPWDRLNFEEILTANSYAQAVNLFRTKRWISFYAILKCLWATVLNWFGGCRKIIPKRSVFFLTCHDDFEFARRAIALECLGYILKPADTEEVVEYLLKSSGKNYEGKSESGLP